MGSVLGDLADITVGHVGPMATEYVPRGIPFLRSLNVERGRLDLTDVRHVTPEFHARLAKSALAPGDVVVVRTGAPGTAALIPYWLPVSNCSDLVVIRPRKGLDSAFLAYYINSESQVFIRSRTVGAVQQHFNVGAARELPLPPIPLDEQQRIAAVLGALDDLIDTNAKLMEHLDALGMAVFLQNWDQTTWVSVSELGEVTMGQSPPSSTYNELGEGLPFFQGVRDFGKRFPSERVFCTEPTRRAEAGDILIAVRAPVGDTNVATAKTAIGRGLGALHAKYPAIALRALRASAQTWAAHQGTGTVFSSINGKDLRAAKVPLVDSSNVESTLQTFDAQYFACSEDIEALRRTRDELLPLLMSGKIRVLPDAGDKQGDQRGAV